MALIGFLDSGSIGDIRIYVKFNKSYHWKWLFWGDMNQI